MRDPLHILVTLDGAYLPHVRTMLYSLHANNEQERFVRTRYSTSGIVPLISVLFGQKSPGRA